MTDESPKPEPAAKYCTACRYRLDHLPENRCPECGRTFDPEDPTTFFSCNTMPVWHRLGRPPGNLSLVATAFFGVLLVLSASQPNYWDLGVGFCGAHLLLIVLFIAYSIRVAAICATHASVSAPAATHIRRRWRWAPLPLPILLLVSTYCTPWLLQIRFGLSRPAFERVVQELESGTHTNTDDQYIGLYRVKAIEPDSTGVWWFMTGQGIADPIGVLYDPSDSWTHHLSRRLAPCWYTAAF